MRTWKCIGALLVALAPAAAADYDIVIRNARVIDGSGNAWFRADVAVKDGRIAALGRIANATGARTIDAQERIVAPGFIDVHTTSRAAWSAIRAVTTSCSTA